MMKQLLMSSNYWTLNKALVKELGIETAFLLTNFIEADAILADSEGWFYQTINTIEEITTLSRYKQDKSIDQLIELGIIQQDNRGIPAKRHFKINEKALRSLMTKATNKIAKNSQTRVQRTRKLDCEKLATNKESTYKESNKENDVVNANKFYQDNFGMITPYISDCIQGMVDELGEDMTIEAMKVALKNNVPKIQYAESCLYNWAKLNIRTPEDLKSHELGRQNKFLQGNKERTGRAKSAKETQKLIDDMWGDD